MQFQVGPRSIDRLPVTVGPDRIQTADPGWPYNFDVVLKYADGRQNLPVTTVTAVAPPSAAAGVDSVLARRVVPGNRCPEDNRDLVAAAARLPGRHTAEFDALDAALMRRVPADPVPAVRTCTPDAPAATRSPLAIGACYRFSPARFDGELRFPPGLSPALTQTSRRLRHLDRAVRPRRR